MKKLIIILILLVLISGVITYFSYTVINEGEVYYIKTKFRPYELYSTSGIYFFPEKILFYDEKAFIQHKLFSDPIELTIPIRISLENFPILKDEQNYTIRYRLSIAYKIDIKFQQSVIRNGKTITQMDKSIKNSIKNRAKALFLNEIQNNLNSEDKISLENLFNTVSHKLSKNITDKFLNQIKIIPNKITHTLVDSPDLELYKIHYQQSKKLNQEMLAIKSSTEKESIKEKAEWEKKKQVILRDIEKLTMYGKLFKEYPESLNYLYLNKLGEKINILVTPKDAKSLFEPFFKPQENKQIQAPPKKITPPQIKKEDNVKPPTANKDE